MAEQDLEFATLMAGVQAGSADAAQQLHEHYARHILRAVRRRLHRKLRPKYDSLDFVQDVWASFFEDVPQKHKFERPEDLVAFLSRMAANKVAQAVRKGLVRQKHNINREASLEADGPADVIARQATASEILMGCEEWEQLLARQPPVHRRVLLLLREGRSQVSIALELGISQKTVHRLIRRVLPEYPS
jgi:RNA polymerase sigma-70 factor (ECF subfamily)